MSLATLLAPLGVTAFTVGHTPMTWLQIIGFATGVLNVWLVARQNLWNWPLGIIHPFLQLLIYATAGLYADSGLQAVYILMNAYGWWAWAFGGKAHGALAVTRTSARTAWALLAGGLGVCGVLYVFLSHFTNSTVPAWDALTTAVSLVALYGQCRKQIENWWLWILADLVYIPLYAYKGLWLMSALFVVYFVLCVVGLRNWQKALDGEIPAGATFEVA